MFQEGFVRGTFPSIQSYQKLDGLNCLYRLVAPIKVRTGLCRRSIKRRESFIGTDVSGNRAQEKVEIRVPHDQGKE